MPADQKSIVLVTVDCLRADHVGFLGYSRATTPFLDGLARESSVVSTAIVAGAPTYYSLPAIMASRSPLALGRDVLGLAPSEPTIASVLRDAGYATAAFTAANPYISARFGYANGFDTFHDFLEGEPEAPPRGKDSVDRGWARRVNGAIQKVAVGPLKKIYSQLYFEYCQRVTPVPASLDALRRFPSADVLVDQACEWLDSAGERPFFLWLHLMDPHSPYYPKNEALAAMGDRQVTPYRARYLNSLWNRSDLDARGLGRRKDELVALYDAGIRWVDTQMARLAEHLRQKNCWQNCVFALTADHGEEFLDHGGRYHPPSKVTEELIHVPLLIRARQVGNSVFRAPFSLLHLAPTLLEAVQCAPPRAFQGRSLWPDLVQGRTSDAVAISECVQGCTNPFHRQNRFGPRILSVRDSRYKLVIRFDLGQDDLYDLEADPQEHAPLPATEQRAVRGRLLQTAREHLSRCVEQRDLSRRTEVRLRELRIEWAKAAATSSLVES